MIFHIFICILHHLRVYYLALINRPGGLYGRILTEVVSTDRTQWGLYTRPRSRFSHTDWLSLVNKMFIIWQARTIWFVWYNWFVITDMWLANSNDLNLILLKFARPLYFFFFLIRLFGTSVNKYCQKKIVNIFEFQSASFSPQLFLPV